MCFPENRLRSFESFAFFRLCMFVSLKDGKFRILARLQLRCHSPSLNCVTSVGLQMLSDAVRRCQTLSDAGDLVTESANLLM